MSLIGWTCSSANPTKGEPNGLILSQSMPICLKVGKYKISAELPLSTKIRWITWFVAVKVMMQRDLVGYSEEQQIRSE
jgi:hypothetical protein